VNALGGDLLLDQEDTEKAEAAAKAETNSFVPSTSGI
jgi:hypothetical protein